MFFNENRGITLIELVVVLAVLSIVISTITGIFVSFLKQQSRILSEQEFLNQTSYTLEYIVRSVRTANQDTVGNCLGNTSYYYILTRFDATASAYQGIKVLSGDGVCHEFFLDTDGLLKEIKDGQSAQPILSGKFDIQYIRFIINGDKSISSVSLTDVIQPRVSVSLSVKELNGENQYKVIQTTVSTDTLNVNTL